MATTKPFLRWAGGKRWLAALLYAKLAPRLVEGATYYEPFLGSGAMFFCLAPHRALLSDLNPELINAFKMIALHSSDIAQRLAELPATRAQYENIRGSIPEDPIDRAVRFVYLNRNCWGGLYRENRGGEFNTPWGGGERNHLGIIRSGALEAAAKLLGQNGIRLEVSDFESCLDSAGYSDIVYCDPTYRQTTRMQFDRYGKTIFGWEDQKRLAEAAWLAFRRGALVIVSNALCSGVRGLYPGAGLIRVCRRKGLGPSRSQKAYAEYLFVLDPMDQWENWSPLGKVIRRQLPGMTCPE